MSEYIVVRPVRLRNQSDTVSTKKRLPDPYVAAWWVNAFASTAIIVLTFLGTISYTAGAITLAAFTYTLFVLIYVKIVKNDKQRGGAHDKGAILKRTLE
jgi:hypothetical protein